MLNDSTVNLLSKDMCVDVNDLYNKLNSSEILSVKDEFVEIIDNFASMILNYDNNYENKIKLLSMRLNECRDILSIQSIIREVVRGCLLEHACEANIRIYQRGWDKRPSLLAI